MDADEGGSGVLVGQQIGDGWALGVGLVADFGFTVIEVRTGSGDYDEWVRNWLCRYDGVYVNGWRAELFGYRSDELGQWNSVHGHDRRTD